MSDDIREEQYLADIRTAAQGGEGYYNLPPIIRKEFYYTDIINALKNGGGGGGGTSDYTQLTNKPEINGTTLAGNKSSSDLGLQDKVLGAWTAGTATTHSTPASTDTVLQALEKIDNNQRNDETNISLLKETADIVDTTSIFELNLNEYTENAYIDRRNGKVVTNAPNAFNCTDYYDIPTICNRILIKTRFVDDAGLAMYDEDKTFIGRYNPKLLKSETIVNTYEVMPPTNAKYIRSSLYAGSTTIANVRSAFRIAFYYDMRILNDKDNDLASDITTLNECLPLLSNFWSYAMDSIICIGDSLTQGCYYGSTWAAKPYDGVPIKENYPYMLSRMIRCDVENAGFGGYSASDWWANKQNTYDFTDYNTAIIWLGTNGGLTDTLDTDCVGDDYTTYANTNTGNYCKIIGKIKQTNPYCKIIIVKIFAAQTSAMVTETNRTIGKIATRYGVTMLDNSGLGVTPHPELHDADNIHFSKSGNIYVANKLIMDMGKYFNDNPLNCEFGFNAS